MELTGCRKELDKGARDNLEVGLRNPKNPKMEPRSDQKVEAVEVLLSWMHQVVAPPLVHERTLLLVLGAEDWHQRLLGWTHFQGQLPRHHLLRCFQMNLRVSSKWDFL